MRDLGSNFLLNGTKLSLDIEKPFVIFQNNQEYLNNEFKCIEPLENVVVETKEGTLKPITDIWWAICYDVRTIFFSGITAAV